MNGEIIFVVPSSGPTENGMAFGVKLFRKNADNMEILGFPDEPVERGDYLIIEDLKANRGLLSQVIDVQYADYPGIMEDLIRDAASDEVIFGDDFDPLQLNTQVIALRDIKLIHAKIRCGIEGNKVTTNVAWTPSRVASTVRPLDVTDVVRMLDIQGKRPIPLGYSKSGGMISINADAFDGKLSIILGRKGTGKSHLAKLLILGLMGYGAPCVVFDMNGEYSQLDTTKDSENNEYKGRIIKLQPAANFKVPLMEAGFQNIQGVLVHALGLPSSSLREFHRIWEMLENRRSLTMKNLQAAIRDWNCNEAVREALISRVSTLEKSGLFSDNEANIDPFEVALMRCALGGVVVINLQETSVVSRQVIVEYVLSKLCTLLKSSKLQAAFLFAEEAHLYLRETYWDDLVTRMRHIGLFTFFITNQPDSIHPSIYRQADSVFLFNFKNDHDLEALSKFARIDVETMQVITRTLEPYHCLTVGEATKEIPLIVRVRDLENVRTMGETRRVFSS